MLVRTTAWMAMTALVIAISPAMAQIGPCPAPVATPSVQRADVEVVLLEGRGDPIDLPTIGDAPSDGSGRFFIAEREGRILVVDGGAVLPTPMLDMSAGLLTENGRGLLGFTLHRDFAVSGAPGEGRMYTWHTAAPGVPADFPVDTPVHTHVLTEWRTLAGNGNVVDPASRREIFRSDHAHPGHTGGGMDFDSNGYLYIALGAAPNRPLESQDTSHPAGTIMRIDPLHPSLTIGSPDPISPNGNYRNPATNPLVGLPGLDEVFAWGVRHPWRLTIDPLTDAVYVGDVGQGSYEEVNRIERGGNYGWPYLEGSCPGIRAMPHPPPVLIDPLVSYGREDGRCVIGGHVYRGSAIPDLWGKYIFADLTQGTGNYFAEPGRLFVLDVYDQHGVPIAPGTGVLRELRIGPKDEGIPLTVFSIAVDGDGELLLLGIRTPSSGAGVYRLVPLDACYADCDPSTGPGVLDIFDFLCFGNRFSAGDPYACDCDMSTGGGVCDIFDFLCFGNAFNAGCP